MQFELKQLIDWIKNTTLVLFLNVLPVSVKCSVYYLRKTKQGMALVEDIEIYNIYIFIHTYQIEITEIGKNPIHFLKIDFDQIKCFLHQP